MIETKPALLIVDLFCGAGGTTTGYHKTEGHAKVIACVNHDPVAIKSHWENYPDVVHFEEDIRTLDLTGLVACVNAQRAMFPDAALVLWASLECTNFSRAKGGQPRDADSRTLADHLHRYIDAISPDYVKIENVVEFMSWGPLDEKGKPVSRRNGVDWMRWRQEVCAHGYRDEWREMNAADFGAYTSRNRLFGIFAKPEMPIAWPQPTHSKKGATDMFGGLEKWRPVREVLDFTDEGQSIFGRKKALSDKTLERIFAGLVKYVAGGKDAWMLKYNSTSTEGIHQPPSVDDPCPTIACQSRLGLVQAHFLSKQFSGNPESKNIPVDGPAGSVTTVDHHALVSSTFLTQYYGNGYNVDTSSPAPTLTTKDRCSLVRPCFITNYYGTSKSAYSVDIPTGPVMPKPKQRLITAVISRRCTWLQPEAGIVAISINESDSETAIRIKEFMDLYGIFDIRMRMLRVPELLQIQGFPEGYRLAGTQTDQKKFIGNSVVPHVVTAWANALTETLNKTRQRVAA